MKKTILALLIVFSAKVNAAPADSFNFNFSPIVTAIGMLNANLEFKLGNSFTLGPTIAYWNLSLGDVKVKLNSGGILMRFYFKNAFESSFFLGSKLVSVSLEQTVTERALFTNTSTQYSGSMSGTSAGFGGGYAWHWNSFNQILGVYVMLSNSNSLELKDSAGNTYAGTSSKYNSSSATPGLEYQLGWTF